MRRCDVFLVLFFGVLGVATPQVGAHEMRPGYLQLRQTDAHTFDVLWKVPAKGDLRLGLYVQMPENCVEVAPRTARQANGAFTERWSVRCPEGLAGQRISIDGLTATFTDVLVRVERMDGTTEVVRLTPSAPSFVVSVSPSWVQVARTYTGLGIEHILFGIDHLLFVLALLMLVKGKRRLIGTITSFTVAHSLTLAAATLGLIHVPQRPVEAVIALSVVFVAAEVIQLQRGRPGLGARWPWVVAFTFGLLHGFGFAGALGEVGLPARAIPVALLFFNVGVELGQVLFILVLLAFVFALRKGVAWGEDRLRRPVPIMAMARVGSSYVIGVTASYWLIERIVAFCV